MFPIHIFHVSFKLGGGMERYARDLSNAFARMGHPVTVHAQHVDRSIPTHPNLSVLQIPVLPRTKKLRSFPYYRAIERIRPGLDGLKISFSCAKSEDLVVCGGTHKGYLTQARKPWLPLNLLQIWMENRIYRFAGGIISHSRLCRDDLIRLYQEDPGKITVLHPPIGPEFSVGTSSNRRELLRRMGVPDDKIVFVFPSTGHRRKGLGPISDAMRSVEDKAVLVVAGKPRAYGRTSRSVIYAGYVADMPSLYRAADYTILGSSYEPFGMVGPESILCGTPLVFDKRIGCLEVVPSNAAIKFSVNSQDSIRAALSEAVGARNRHQLPPGPPHWESDYDPSIDNHARRVLEAGRRAQRAKR